VDKAAIRKGKSTYVGPGASATSEGCHCASSRYATSARSIPARPRGPVAISWECEKEGGSSSLPRPALGNSSVNLCTFEELGDAGDRNEVSEGRLRMPEKAPRREEALRGVAASGSGEVGHVDTEKKTCRADWANAPAVVGAL
jgi:hypothetical protein